MLPAFAVVAARADVTRSLILSQLVLSLALPVPMVALVVLSRRRDVMGAQTTSGVTFAAAACGSVATIALNAALLWQQVG